ncbi:MAG: hypothetical protein L6461_13305 [Anaerolineae bacterium]|nr:hypothetical protein [Anaerolineae bacterium]
MKVDETVNFPGGTELTGSFFRSKCPARRLIRRAIFRMPTEAGQPPAAAS